MTYYYGIICFRNGTTRTTGKTNSRQQAERIATSKIVVFSFPKSPDFAEVV